MKTDILMNGSTGSLGSHGPKSSDDNRNTRCRLDTFSCPEDEHARSAVLLRFLCEQYHAGVSAWINSIGEKSNIPAHNKPIRIQCKTGSLSVRLVFETRAKCQDFGSIQGWVKVSPTKFIVHFAKAEPVSLFANTSHFKTVKLDNILRLCGKFWPNSSKFLFLKEMTQVHFHCPCAFDVRSRVLSIKDRRNGVGKTSVQTCSFGKRTGVCPHWS